MLLQGPAVLNYRPDLTGRIGSVANLIPTCNLRRLTIRMAQLAGPLTQNGIVHLKVTICITQGPAEPSVAVALLLPVTFTVLSSARSLSGEVIIRAV